MSPFLFQRCPVFLASPNDTAAMPMSSTSPKSKPFSPQTSKRSCLFVLPEHFSIQRSTYFVPLKNPIDGPSPRGEHGLGRAMAGAMRRNQSAQSAQSAHTPQTIKRWPEPSYRSWQPVAPVEREAQPQPKPSVCLRLSLIMS